MCTVHLPGKKVASWPGASRLVTIPTRDVGVVLDLYILMSKICGIHLLADGISGYCWMFVLFAQNPANINSSEIVYRPSPPT